MKKRSSLKTRMWELFPLVVSRMTTPVHSPCNTRNGQIGTRCRRCDERSKLYRREAAAKSSRWRGRWWTRSSIGSPRGGDRWWCRCRATPRRGWWTPRRCGRTSTTRSLAAPDKPRDRTPWLVLSPSLPVPLTDTHLVLRKEDQKMGEKIAELKGSRMFYVSGESMPETLALNPPNSVPKSGKIN